MSGSVVADGDFWFRVDRRGRVHGHAVVGQGGLGHVKGGAAAGTLTVKPGTGEVNESRTAYWSAQRIGR